MSEFKTCSQCGEVLPTDAPSEICSVCMRRGSLPPGESSSRDDRVNDAILLYLQAVERGEAVDREKFLAEHAEIAEELNSFFGNQAQFQQVAEAATLPPVASIEQRSFDHDQTTLVPATTAIPSAGEVVRYFGDYELLLEIARGGMGVVYKAWQVNLNRVVALKMILAGQLAGPQDVQRFYTEAKAAAQLDHPGIVPVFEVGQNEGQHFFSMGFVEGKSLAARVAKGPLPPREAAELVRDVAQAVQYAHDKGVIHRDLKPGNILLDTDGRPRVTDFGLAKLTRSDSDLTSTGQILGTPSYMPPEQASGKTDQIGPAADIYALGAVLYCLLVGRPPFQAANPMDTLLQVLEQEPVPLRQLNAQIERDLETICLKCLAKSPDRRYVSALELSNDLNRFLNDQPILARPPSVWERANQWARNHVVTVTTIMLLLASSVFMIPLAQLSDIVQQSTKQQRADLDGAPESTLSELDTIRSTAIVREMTQMIQREPKNSSARFDRARALLAEGANERAVDDLSAAIQLESQRADYYSLRGLAELRRKRHDRAIEDFTTAIELRPELFDAHFRRAQAWLATDELSKSLEDINRAIALRPACGEAYLLRGSIFQRQGNAGQFVQDFKFAGRLGVPPP